MWPCVFWETYNEVSRKTVHSDPGWRHSGNRRSSKKKFPKTKTHRGIKGTALLFLWLRRKIGVGGQRNDLADLTSGRKRVDNHFTGGWMWSWVKRNSSPREFDPQTVQPVTSHYAYWAIPDRHRCSNFLQKLALFLSADFGTHPTVMKTPK